MSVNCQLHIDKLFQAFQVLAEQFHIIVTCTLHPQWFDGSGTSLVDGQAMIFLGCLQMGDIYKVMISMNLKL